MKLLALQLATFLLAVLWTVWNPGLASAGGSSERLVLVVNAGSAASLSVANEYISLRNLPPQNVIYLTNIIDAETWDLKSFKERILKPIIATLQERKLVHVDYIVYSADFPTAISIKVHQVMFLDRARVPGGNRKIFGSVASINALTYFARQVIADDPSYLGMEANLYMRSRAAKLLIQPFVGETQTKFQVASEKYERGDYGAAEAEFSALAKTHPRQVAVQYWLARAIAKQGDMNKTIDQLLKCIKAGWPYRDFTRDDEAFAEWKESKLFQRVVERIPNYDWYYLPTTGFRANDVWGPNGARNGTPDQGQRYFLSTVLAVTRNRGTTEAEAIQNLRTSVAADHTAPNGTFYFSKTTDVRSTTRASHFERVIGKLEELGFKGEVITTKLPQKKDDVLGITLGAAAYGLASAKLKIIPGAIIENLTSYGGVMRAKGSQTPLSEGIKAGAAGSSGTVTEPYAIINKFPHPNIHLHYVRGSTMAEAFYQSVHAPYMLLIVGDALCQPWSKKTQFEITGLPRDKVIKGKHAFTIKAGKDAGQPGIAEYEIYLDGHFKGRAAVNQPINLDSSSTPDGHHQLRVVAIAKHELRWRTSQTIGFWVNNHDQKSSLEIAGSNKAKFADQVELRFNSVVPKVDGPDDNVEVAIFHNRRILATMKKASGTIKVDTAKIGRGKIQLQAARKIHSKWIFSKPLDLEVTY